VTVREVIRTTGEVMGRQIDYDVVGRRAGDPAAVVGRVDRIADELGWHAELGLTEMIADAWAARPR
jgi:UDP-glucose 4-epimerase